MPTQLHPTKLVKIKNTTGFTLLEVMVALVIFSLLAVTGWQVFDGLNKTKERAKMHADGLSDLQYAYLQLQNDLSQVTAWQTAQLNHKSKSSVNNSNNSLFPFPKTSLGSKETSKNTDITAYETPAFITVEPQSIRFIRYADPDPRYKTSPTFNRVSYTLVEDKLVRQQFFTLAEDSKSIDSVVLEEVAEVNWQALLPEPSGRFSSITSQATVNDNQHSNTNQNKKNKTQPMLPKGVSVNFNYRDNPIEWLFALPSEAPALSTN